MMMSPSWWRVGGENIVGYVVSLHPLHAQIDNFYLNSPNDNGYLHMKRKKVMLEYFGYTCIMTINKGQKKKIYHPPHYVLFLPLR